MNEPSINIEVTKFAQGTPVLVLQAINARGGLLLGELLAEIKGDSLLEEPPKIPFLYDAAALTLSFPLDASFDFRNMKQTTNGGLSGEDGKTISKELRARLLREGPTARNEREYVLHGPNGKLIEVIRNGGEHYLIDRWQYVSGVQFPVLDTFTEGGSKRHQTISRSDIEGTPEHILWGAYTKKKHCNGYIWTPPDLLDGPGMRERLSFIFHGLDKKLIGVLVDDRLVLVDRAEYLTGCPMLNVYEANGSLRPDATLSRALIKGTVPADAQRVTADDGLDDVIDRMVTGCSACGEDHMMQFVRQAKPKSPEGYTHMGMCSKAQKPVWLSSDDAADDDADASRDIVGRVLREKADAAREDVVRGRYEKIPVKLKVAEAATLDKGQSPVMPGCVWRGVHGELLLVASGFDAGGGSQYLLLSLPTSIAISPGVLNISINAGELIGQRVMLTSMFKSKGWEYIGKLEMDK